jgi:RNA-directed DNA polymerase
MNVGEMQRKLSNWARDNQEQRFFDLYHLLYDKDWLRLAHDHVKANAGSITAGCDGINMAIFDQDLETNLLKLAEDLKSEQFVPKPARRIYIPKSNGKKRPLGISTIRDRIVQEALRMVLEPIYEADFSQYSFGFRPNRCTMDAIKCITWSVAEHKKFFWVIEGDISSYFDTINHRKLMKLLSRRIRDQKLLNLVWKFLKAGIMERKMFRATERGAPQGGICSPLLANVYLHELDKYMERYTNLSRQEKRRRRSTGQANFVYVRYADDWVVLCNGTKEQAQALREELRDFLKQELKLELSEEKTKVTHLNEGFKFLGFWIYRGIGSKGITTKVDIPKAAIERIRTKIRKITDKSTHNDSVNAKIMALNRVLRGWSQYYQYTSKAGLRFNRVSHLTFWRFAHWLGRKFKLKMTQVMRQYRQEHSLGVGKYTLIKLPTKARHYQKAFLKPNPYLESDGICREKLPTETYWTGCEIRPGWLDLRPLVLERDDYLCQRCGIRVTSRSAEVDHKRPYRRYKSTINANNLDNLQTLCVSCHKQKTKSDHQRESGVH